jgi:hypothetical protein
LEPEDNRFQTATLPAPVDVIAVVFLQSLQEKASAEPSTGHNRVLPDPYLLTFHDHICRYEFEMASFNQMTLQSL